MRNRNGHSLFTRELLLAFLLVIAANAPGYGAARPAPKARKPVSKLSPQIAKQIIATANREGLDPFLVLEVMRRESAFNPWARSNKGAGGLMQLIPSSARRFGITDPYDPQQAIAGGCRYLKYLMERFPGRLDLVLASYNAGEGAVARYGNTVPPFSETRHYVEAITYGYKRAKWIEQNELKMSGPTRLLTKQEIRDRLPSLEPPQLGRSTKRESPQ